MFGREMSARKGNDSDSSPDLFAWSAPAAPSVPTDPSRALSATAPLAHRMRPRNLEEFFGQTKALGDGKLLKSWIETDRLPNLVFWGPPGCGKTTLARIISSQTRSAFLSLSAVTSGVKDIKESVERARFYASRGNQRTILFVDEIHRFNKSQQDALLPHIEEGVISLIGATTENPSFSLNAALLSRSKVVRLERLSEEDLQKIIRHALGDRERGLNGSLRLTGKAIEWIASRSEGDARKALGMIESLSFSGRDAQGEVDLEEMVELLTSERTQFYDRSGEEHYNVISAFIKSIRGSDPHAGLYYLARMLESGEDPMFIARRLVILAAEDVGNADPRALQIAVAVKDAVAFLGLPEGRIPLAQAVTYLAAAPKSNAAYAGISEALDEVRESGSLPVPFHLRNAPTRLMKTEGYGEGYQYAHDQVDQRVKQYHLPEALRGRRFYHPKEIGLEKQILEKLNRINSDFD